MENGSRHVYQVLSLRLEITFDFRSIDHLANVIVLTNVGIKSKVNHIISGIDNIFSQKVVGVDGNTMAADICALQVHYLVHRLSLSLRQVDLLENGPRINLDILNILVHVWWAILLAFWHNELNIFADHTSCVSLELKIIGVGANQAETCPTFEHLDALLIWSKIFLDTLPCFYSCFYFIIFFWKKVVI